MQTTPKKESIPTKMVSMFDLDALKAEPAIQWEYRYVLYMDTEEGRFYYQRPKRTSHYDPSEAWIQIEGTPKIRGMKLPKFYGDTAQAQKRQHSLFTRLKKEHEDVTIKIEAWRKKKGDSTWEIMTKNSLS